MAAWVNQIIAADGLEFGIREKGVREVRELAKIGGDVRWIHADGYRPHTGVLKFVELFFDSSQLEVTEWSPVSAIEDQQDCLRTLQVSHGTGEQLRKGD